MTYKEKQELYRQTFTAGNGPAVLLDLEDEFHIADTTYVPDSPNETAYREGQRSVVLHLLRLIEQRPDIEKLLQERHSDAQRETGTTITGDTTGGRW